MAENTNNQASNNPRPQGDRRSFSPRFNRPQNGGSGRPNNDGRPFQRSGDQGGQRRFNSRPGGKDSRFGGKPKFGNKRRPNEPQNDDFSSKVVQVRRVTRVVKGGKRMRFSALVVVGDKNGRFGVGLKKGNDYADAVNKATAQAKKNIHHFTLTDQESIPFTVNVKFKAARILLKPAKSGTGLIAGGPIRSILELAGIKNIYSKIIGSNNKISNIVAVEKALTKLGKEAPKKEVAAPVVNS
ncbi:MAG: 30S ribosomal protein S5 [Patescibacteria group bacterium]